jgi:DNA-binding LytR/AlgR family response regulator
MNILLVEDELPAARQLAKLLQQTRPEFRLLATLDSVESAVNWLKNSPSPELIFMDIQIADGLSFDIFRQTNIKCPVIFTTAFDHYAVQAFKVNAIDYLLKPVDPVDLQRAIEKFESQKNAPVFDYDTLTRLIQSENYKDRFLVKNGQHFAFVKTTDIAFFRSSDGLTQAFCVNGKKHFIDHSLEELERLLNPKEFFRINRGITLGVSSIQRISPYLNGRLKIETEPKCNEDVVVSRDRVLDFKAWLGG